MANTRVINEGNADVILNLISNNFSVRQVSVITGFAERTIWRYLNKSGIRIRNKYSIMSNKDLTKIISRMINENENLGAVMIDGRLKSIGHQVQREKIRATVKFVTGKEGIPHKPIKRRKYSVRSPLSVVHIDGYLKLNRWKLPIHGGIDGFSRIGFYLKVSRNNTAGRVLECFREGVKSYGLPSRVRSDKGGENIAVGRYMIMNMGLNRASFISGRSVFNQRIERWWRDVWNSCISVYYNYFLDMEDEGLLVPDNELDIYCLHICFFHLIQQDLDTFREAWNLHKIRTANNMSPQQLFIAGLDNLARYAAEKGMIFTELIQDETWRPNLTQETVTAPYVDIDNKRCPVPPDVDRKILRDFNEANVTKGNVREVYVYLRERIYEIYESVK